LNGVPWATIITVVVAVIIFESPGADRALVYDRLRIHDGEWWRVFTGAWVHFSSSHLLWNLAVLVPAGIWCERLAPGRTRWLLLLAPVVIGGIVYAAEPGLERFAGLSGVASAMLTLLAVTQLRLSDSDRWFWRAVLALLALKVAAEAIRASPVLAHFPDPGMRSVALAHLAGIGFALVVHAVRRGRRSRAN
jgi:rhomboid family GlyGly-CTERM serine protease